MDLLRRQGKFSHQLSVEPLSPVPSKFHNTECVWVQDGSNCAVYVLGLKKSLEKNIVTAANGVKVWDPLHKHVSASAKRTKAMDKIQPPRPPNAFILYRKDKHPEIKESYPDIHNNEICMFYLL